MLLIDTETASRYVSRHKVYLCVAVAFFMCVQT